MTAHGGPLNVTCKKKPIVYFFIIVRSYIAQRQLMKVLYMSRVEFFRMNVHVFLS